MTTENTGAPAAPAAPAAGEAPAGAVAPSGAPLAIGEAPAPIAPVAAPAAPDAGGAVAYEATGDVGLDMALNFVGNLGLGPEDPAMVAATNGDFSILRAKLGALGAKAQGWEGFVALAEKSFTEGKGKAEAKATADRKTITEAVGGEENWSAISKWAGENAEPAEKEAVNSALKQGGLVAKITAQWLASKHAAASGTKIEPAEVTAPGAAGRPASAGPLTAAQYATEVQALRTKLGYGMEGSPMYTALQQRRNVGRASGI